MFFAIYIKANDFVIFELKELKLEVVCLELKKCDLLVTHGIDYVSTNSNITYHTIHSNRTAKIRTNHNSSSRSIIDKPIGTHCQLNGANNDLCPLVTFEQKC